MIHHSMKEFSTTIEQGFF